MAAAAHPRDAPLTRRAAESEVFTILTHPGSGHLMMQIDTWLRTVVSLGLVSLAS